MQLKIVRETEYLKADLRDRETPEEMREAIWAILTECRKTGMSTVLISTRASRPLFKLQEFGLTAFLDEMSSSCRVVPTKLLAFPSKGSTLKTSRGSVGESAMRCVA